MGEALGDASAHRPEALTESCHDCACAEARGIKRLGLSGNPVGDSGAKAIAAAAAASTQELAFESGSVEHVTQRELARGSTLLRLRSFLGLGAARAGLHPGENMHCHRTGHGRLQRS